MSESDDGGDYADNPIRIIDPSDTAEIEKLKLDDPDSHVLGCFFGKSHENRSVNRIFKFGEAAQNVLKRLNAAPYGPQSDLLYNNNLVDGQKFFAKGDTFVSLDVEGQSLYMSEHFLKKAAFAVYEKVNFVHEKTNDGGIGFAVIPVQLTSKERAVMIGYFHEVLNGVIRLTDGSMFLICDRNTNSMYRLDHRDGHVHKCDDGTDETMAGMTMFFTKEKMEQHKALLCRAEVYIIVDPEGIIRIHIKPHSKSQLHHENHCAQRAPPTPKNMKISKRAN